MSNANAKSPTNTYDFDELTKNLQQISQQSGELLHSYLNNQSDWPSTDSTFMNEAANTFISAMSNLAADPQKLIESQFNFYQQYVTLLSNTTARIMGEDMPPAFESATEDRRFKNEAWQENFVFDYIKQSYLLTNQWLQNTNSSISGLDDTTSQKLDFYSKQFMDAMSPSNFLMTNPEVIQETLQSNGQNLIDGFKHLLDDLEQSNDGTFNMSVTDTNAFEVGRNLATTKGSVIFENDLLQLIQYSPSTKQVNQTPVLIISPWINKYYVLDMREDNSFVKWLVDQGHTVFITSWLNPAPDACDFTFDDYMQKGSLAAIDAVKQATGEDHVNLIGYCIGGTLTAMTLAYLKEHKKSDCIKSTTFLTTLLDFSIPGDLGIFITEDHINGLKKTIAEKGYFDGKQMATMFSMLRANDLIWSFAVRNYLMGREPLPFDLLYWNSDSTNMPAKMHMYYLQNMYQQNKLVQPNALNLLNTDIDIGSIDTPCYFLSTIEDHITPWNGVYKATQLLSGDLRFVLSGSGHVAGVVNPPAKQKYGYRVNETYTHTQDYPSAPDQWLNTAENKDGSWWTDWNNWMKEKGHTGESIAAKPVGQGTLKPIEPAPGRYVKARFI